MANSGVNNPMYGKLSLNRGCKHSDEAKEKMKAAWYLKLCNGR